MDNLHLDFQQAKAKHLLFKSKLRSILYGETIDETPVLSQYECSVGKWIYSHALARYKNIPEIHHLESIHADIHTSARELVNLYKAGHVEKARQGLHKMERIAEQLINLLDTIEEKIKNLPEEPHFDGVLPIEKNELELKELWEANKKLDQIIKEQSGQLLKERQLLKDFFMQAPATFATTKGPDHVFELANPSYRTLVGDREIVGKSFLEAFPDIKDQGFLELLDNVYQTGKPFFGKEVPINIERTKGQKECIYCNFTYQALYDTEQQIEGILIFAYEVTEQVLARNIIEESNKKIQFMSEAMPQKVWTADALGNIDYLNNHWMEYSGISYEILKNGGWKNIIHLDDIGENLRVWENALKTGAPFQIEQRFKRHDGEYRWHLSRGIPKKDENGNVMMWIGTNTEIHDLKTTQEQLKHHYEDLEVKVKFRNIELEREISRLNQKIESLTK
jgi:PAS domain S-box-containing protein